LHPFFCDHCEEAARGEDCEAAREEGDEATGEGLKPSDMIYALHYYFACKN